MVFVSHNLFDLRLRIFHRSSSQVLGTAEDFLAATGHLLNSEDTVVPAELRSFLIQLDKALGSSQMLLIGLIANCTLSKRAEFLEIISVAESLRDSLLKSPLTDKMFGSPIQRIQEEPSKNPLPVKVSVQVNIGKRTVNATSSSTSNSASGDPPSSAKKRKNNYYGNYRTNPITPVKAQVSLLVVLRVPRNLGLAYQYYGNENRFACTESFQLSLKNQSVILAMDITTVVAYLKIQGGTDSPSLYQITRDILPLCFQLQVLCVMRHIAGRLNILADTLSISLAPGSFQKL
ncbi:unnamed protein product [Mytilus edulis]|uniref:Uncharacterized protein n=1 Tax=Mytilus edulis TaxID=6550 RepID=A0A8S3QK57_MYTED|nr:unnamed protein product [Mytilus edulis]